MNRTVRLGVMGVWVWIAVAANPVWADATRTAVDPYHAGHKLGRGLANILTGYWEIPMGIVETTKAKGALSGMSVGIGKGVALTFCRTLVGVYEVVTFPFPLPARYEPIYRPEFVWQEV